MEKVFGIDLGTTYSCIAYVDEYGKPVVVPNSDSERITPSVVCFDEGNEVIVGKVAKEQLKIDPGKVIDFIKREMGNSGFLFPVNGIDYQPEEISSFILQKLVKDASENTGFKITDVVITCPAYFGINEKTATKLAGEIAGLNVRAIIPEPTAAAVAYGIDKVENQTVLVYDLGGGTFDITMIKVQPGNIEVVVTGGSHHLGGKDWDDALMGYFATRFAEETGVRDDIFSDMETFGSMRISAEEAKKTLTLKDKANTAVIYGTDKAKIETTREKFNEITSHLAETTIALTKQMLADARAKGVLDFDKILLVGGSTRMPQIKEMLTRHFPGKPVEMFDPDESVAKGAAIYGQQLAVNGELIEKIAEQTGRRAEDIDIGTVSESQLNRAAETVAAATGLSLGSIKKSAHTGIVNVVSKSFGIKVITNMASGQEMISNIIKKQSSVPAELTQTYYTVDRNQTRVDIDVYENELAGDHVEISQSKQLGTGKLEGLPPNLPAGSPFDVTFRINENGLLDITAVEQSGNRKVNFQIQTSDVMNPADVAAAKIRSTSLKIS
ncbi:MAG: Hsp70 family protein [Chitinispirillia bacterium]|nr:Hsp70 family protein [Chitinispirillia bacterium]